MEYVALFTICKLYSSFYSENKSSQRLKKLGEAPEDVTPEPEPEPEPEEIISKPDVATRDKTMTVDAPSTNRGNQDLYFLAPDMLSENDEKSKNDSMNIYSSLRDYKRQDRRDEDHLKAQLVPGEEQFPIQMKAWSKMGLNPVHREERLQPDPVKEDRGNNNKFSNLLTRNAKRTVQFSEDRGSKLMEPIMDSGGTQAGFHPIIDHKMYVKKDPLIYKADSMRADNIVRGATTEWKGNDHVGSFEINRTTNGLKPIQGISKSAHESLAFHPGAEHMTIKTNDPKPTIIAPLHQASRISTSKIPMGSAMSISKNSSINISETGLKPSRSLNTNEVMDSQIVRSSESLYLEPSFIVPRASQRSTTTKLASAPKLKASLILSNDDNIRMGLKTTAVKQFGQEKNEIIGFNRMNIATNHVGAKVQQGPGNAPVLASIEKSSKIGLLTAPSLAPKTDSKPGRVESSHDSHSKPIPGLSAFTSRVLGGSANRIRETIPIDKDESVHAPYLGGKFNLINPTRENPVTESIRRRLEEDPEEDDQLQTNIIGIQEKTDDINPDRVNQSLGFKRQIIRPLNVSNAHESTNLLSLKPEDELDMLHTNASIAMKKYTVPVKSDRISKPSKWKG